MTRNRIFAMLLAGIAMAGASRAQTPNAGTRGELLYSTHCITCHSAQIHWRDGKIASNWAGLTSQVDRWQKASGLGWRDDDVTEVARYLNTLYYRFPAPDAASAPAADGTSLTRQ
jgi:mono/diheme cytochrome c family protein